MTRRSPPVLVLTFLAFSAGCSASGGTTPGASAAAHDSFNAYVATETDYQYDCAAQPPELALGFGGDGRGYAVMKTLGCAWSASNPTIEIDVQIQSTTPIQNQTFDLASTPPATIQITSGMIAGSSSQIFASWENNPMPVNGGALQITTAGTSGTVVVHSFDPTTGSLDVSFNDVYLPGTGGVAIPMIIVSGEVTR